jgi:proteasome lid subunit RPN8/RPN11
MLALEKRYVQEMIAHALKDDPNECCGLIAGKDGRATKLYRMTNVSASPYRYDMDGKEMIPILNEIDDNGGELLAIYHSHTHSQAYPSATDVRLATWPEAYYILVSLLDHQKPEVRAYRIQEGKVTEEELKVA